MDCVLSFVGERLAQYLLSFCQKMIGFRKEIRETKAKISQFEQNIEIFCNYLREANQTNSELQNWLEEIEDLVYDMEDILEVHHENNQQQECLFSWGAIKMYSELHDEVNEIMARIDNVNKRKELIGNANVTSNVIPNEMPTRNGEPQSNELKLFGRASEKEIITNFLLQPNEGEGRFDFISIVGMGGLGKTTLVQHVYKDEAVVNAFDIKAWATATVEFDTFKIFKSIIRQVTGSCNVDDPSAVQNILSNVIKDKKFLIVLDDLWEEKFLNIDQFRSPFSNAAPGSKFIVTTRIRNIALRITKVQNILSLPELSDEDCWSLFSTRSDLGRNARPELVNIGKEIADKCAGVPIAAVVIGSHLRGHDTEEEWRRILDDESWIFNDGQLEIISVLKLSYDKLPYRLKCCLAFIAVFFPEDFPFDFREMAHLMIAAGLIRNRSVAICQALASKYFEELVSKSILVHNKEEPEGNNGMQYLIRQMGRSVNNRRYQFINSESSVASDKSKHIAADIIPNFFVAKSAVRSLRLTDVSMKEQDMDAVLLSLPKLRLLWLENLNISRMSKTLGQMRYLKYLGIYYCEELEQLPAEIGMLQCLSVIEIKECLALTQLPPEIGNLKKLSYIKLTSIPKITQLPSDIGRLSNLYDITLLDLEELTLLPPEIGNCSRLSFLQITRCPNLTQLPSDIGKLCNLTHLIIMQCPRLTELPSEIGNLESLENLEIIRCAKLTQIPLEIGNLSKLKSLSIRGCKLLTHLPMEIEKLSCLTKLYLWNLHELTQLPTGIEGMEKLSISLFRCLKLKEISSAIRGKLMDSQEVDKYMQNEIKYLWDEEWQ